MASDLVDLTRHYLNRLDRLDRASDLLKRLRAVKVPTSPDLGSPADGQRSDPLPRRRVAERLPAGSLPAIVQRFEAGATIQAVANEFGISPSSVKRILRRAGVGRRLPTP